MRRVRKHCEEKGVTLIGVRAVKSLCGSLTQEAASIRTAEGREELERGRLHSTPMFLF